MSDDAVLRHQFRCRDSPLVRRCQQEAFASLSARLLEVVAALPHVSARVDDHAAVDALRAFKLHRSGASGIGFTVARYLQSPLGGLLFEVAIRSAILRGGPPGHPAS